MYNKTSRLRTVICAIITLFFVALELLRMFIYIDQQFQNSQIIIWVLLYPQGGKVDTT